MIHYQYSSWAQSYISNNINDQGCCGSTAAGTLQAVPHLYEMQYSVQLTLWSGSVPREAANGACLFTQPLPQNAP